MKKHIKFGKKINLNFFKNKKILITGCSGFKGTWFSLILNLVGAKVYGASIIKKDDLFFKKLKMYKIINFKKININNKKKFYFYYKHINPDIVIHFASESLVDQAYEKPLKTLKTNVIGLANILDVIKNFTKKKIILLIATSDKCYENNNNKLTENSKLGCNEIYSASKACQEIITQGYYKSFIKNDKKIKIITTRAGNIIGPYDFNKGRLIPDIFQSIINNKKIYIRSKYSSRPWQSVFQCLKKYMQIINYVNKKNIKYSSWNVGNESKIKVYDIIKYLVKKNILKSKNISYLKKNNLNESKNIKLSHSKFEKIFGKDKIENILKHIEFSIVQTIFFKKNEKNSNKIYLYLKKNINKFLEISSN